MIKHLNNFFKRIFSNEETVIFALIIVFTLIIFSFFAAILTPFIVSIVAAYLLVGLQKKIESYNVSETIAKILAFTIFIIIGVRYIINKIGEMKIYIIQHLFLDVITFKEK